jgi:5,10-methenyltetrahydrofolate synthetase
VNDLRRYIAELRKNLTAEDIAANSARGVTNLATWLTKNSSKLDVIGMYRPLGKAGVGEIDPTGLIKHPAFAKSHFAFPRVFDRFNCEMDFAIPMTPNDWVKGVFGNAEPRTDLPPVEPFDLDALIIPGVVFGVSGERIGMGSGFYDRFLAQSGGATRIGFGFDFQLLSEPVPQEDWDARMDVVITDLRTAVASAGVRL